MQACISHFAVVVIKHCDYGNLEKSSVGLMSWSVRSQQAAGTAAGTEAEAHVLNH